MEHVFTLGDTTAGPDLVGGKAWNLGELMRVAGVAVPPGHVVSTGVLACALAAPPLSRLARRLGELLDGADGGPAFWRQRQPEIAAAARALRSRIGALPIERGAAEEIARAVRSLKSATGVGTFAVRSSGTAEDLADASFAGMYHTELFCAERHVGAAVRRCFASLFSDRAVRYRFETAARLSGNAGAAGKPPSLAVVIQPMMRARSSGVAFSVDPVSGDPVITLEAGHGVGKLVVDNSITCDRWRLSGDGLAILERALGSKAQALRQGLRSVRARLVDVGPEERQRFCLSDVEVVDIGRQVRAAADHFARVRGWPAVDIEFAVDVGGAIWFLQARSETTRHRPRSGLVEGVPRDRAASAPVIFRGGVPASLGAARGHLTVCTGVDDARRRVDESSILVAHEITPEWEEVVFLPAAIVAEVGGVHSHPAIVSRERQVPCLVAAAGAVDALAPCEGTPATLDSTNARVYGGHLALESGRPSRFRIGEPDAVPVSEDARLGITVHHVDEDGEQFIGKPEYPLGLWQRTLYLEAWDLAEAWLGVRLQRKVDHQIIYVSRRALSDLAAAMRARDRRWLVELLERRRDAVGRLISASARFEPTARVLDEFYARYREAVAHFHLRFTYQLVLDGLIGEEPDAAFLSRRGAQGGTETARAAAVYCTLLAEAERCAGVLSGDVMMIALALEQGGYHALMAAVRSYARSYKHQSDDIRLPPPEGLILQRLRDDVRSSRRRRPPSEPAVHRGDDVTASPDGIPGLAALAEAAAVQKEFEHHALVRLQWPVRDGLLRLGAAFVLRQWMKREDEVFETPPDELLSLAARLERASPVIHPGHVAQQLRDAP